MELLAVLVIPGLVRLKVDIDGKMAGFIGGDAHRSEGIGWITTVGVRPEYRRLGLASKLILACEEPCRCPLCGSRCGAPILALQHCTRIGLSSCRDMGKVL